MEGTLLIAGSETNLGTRLKEKLKTETEKIFIPVNKEEGSDPEESISKIPWNPGSVFSAKTVIRESMRYNNKLNTAIFIFSDSMTNETMENLNVQEIDQHINTQIKSFSTLLREVYQNMLQKGEGRLVFCQTGRTRRNLSPLNSAALGYYRYLADSLMITPGQSVSTIGFQSDSQEIDAYADFIIDTLNKNDQKTEGEWLLFSDRKLLFNNTPVVKRKY